MSKKERKNCGNCDNYGTDDCNYCYAIFYNELFPIYDYDMECEKWVLKDDSKTTDAES